ncbi:MAG TPA: cobalamin-independent methionine synthase II family protein [Burkholderiales bacterium]
MTRDAGRLLTTHVGSLPRPDAVFEALRRRENGEEDDAAARERVVREAVAAAVRRQKALGIDVPSDGEMSKISYATYVKDRLSGFGGDNERRPHRDLRDFPELRRKMALLTGPQAMRRLSCIGPVAVKDRSALARDLANFRAALDAAGVAEGFLNAASPGVVAVFQPNRYYPSHEAYVEAVAEAMREEYQAIVGAGFLLQVDCPDLAMGRHTAFQDLSEKAFLARAEHQVEALNHALAGLPAERLRMHVCWGNYEGPHDHDIELSKILAIVLKAKPQAISLESANPRHAHEWAIWKEAQLPDDKVLIPGVIDSCSNYVEHPELVAERLCRFADLVGRERVIAGTDCGFGTHAGHGKLDPEVAWRKLGALVEGARLASERLWH